MRNRYVVSIRIMGSNTFFDKTNMGPIACESHKQALCAAIHYTIGFTPDVLLLKRKPFGIVYEFKVDGVRYEAEAIES